MRKAYIGLEGLGKHVTVCQLCQHPHSISPQDHRLKCRGTSQVTTQRHSPSGSGRATSGTIYIRPGQCTRYIWHNLHSPRAVYALHLAQFTFAPCNGRATSSTIYTRPRAMDALHLAQFTLAPCNGRATSSTIFTRPAQWTRYI